MGRNEDFGAKLVGQERALSTSRSSPRLLKGGGAAVGLARTMLRARDGEVDEEALRGLTARLGELKGVGMKLGQIMSYVDRSLPEESRAVLAVLQRQAAASQASEVRAQVTNAFGERASVLLATMEPRPIAVASIGQVHRAHLGGYGDVAVKVLHPGITRALAADFSAAVGGVGLANALTFGAATNASAMVDEVRGVMLAECDLRQEAKHQREFREWLTGDDTLIVPEVIDAWSSDTVLTTRWEPGDSLDAFLAKGPSQAERDRAGAALFRVSVRGFHELGLLYADPHPGNFAFRDGHVVLYDFGCVRRFNRAQTESFAAMTTALRADDREAFVAAARAFGFTVSGAQQVALLERFARSFFAPMLQPGPSVIPPDGAFEAKQLMKDKRALMQLGLPAHLMFLLRLRFGLYAVLSQLGARCDWAQLEVQPGRADVRAAR